MDIEKHKDTSTVPGFGVAGQVFCPYMRAPCFKGGCELWVELSYGKHKVGRCAFAWQAVLMVELRQEIEKARKGIDK